MGEPIVDRGSRNQVTLKITTEDQKLLFMASIPSESTSVPHLDQAL